MSQDNQQAKSTKAKSNSGGSDSGSSEGKSGGSVKSGSKSPKSVYSDYSAYDSGMSSNMGSREFVREMYEFADSHPMDKLTKEIDTLKNEYIKVKDEEEKALEEEHKEIQNKRKEERLKMLAESDVDEKKSNDEVDFLKEDHTDTKIRGGFTEFLSNLNPFKKPIQPMKKEILLDTYLPGMLIQKERIMKDLGITHKYEPYPQTILHTCPNSVFFFDSIERLRQELDRNNEKESITNRILDHNNECLKNFGLFDFELPDNKTKFGNVIGSIGEYHVRLYELENDLIKYQPDLDYITLADDYKLAQNDMNTLENINFCLLNPKTLENFLKKKEIMQLMGEDPVAYDEKFTKYMEESINCHLESLIYDDLDSSQDIKIVLKNVKSKLYLLQNGLSYKSKKLINKRFNEIQKEPDALFEKLTWIFENMYNIKRNYTFFAFKTVCDRFVSRYHILSAYQTMTTYIMEYTRLYGSCFKNIIIYNAVMSGIHEQMKNLFKLMPRTPMLSSMHFESILPKENKKIKRTDYVQNEYDPSIKAFALNQLERLPMVSVINSFFEAKKKELSKKIAQMKLDLFSLTNEDLKIPKDNGPNSKLTAKLISIYKSEIKKYFKEMRDDYIYLIKTRYKSHYKKNYLLYKRLE
ncbi:rhoptry-associated protein 1, putative [Plasmodium knowlesi strain H]|uniref:Rhoptry-associated protein 1, putative n=3 Tax=Plasmodium knowlesi TaxID=5850 RepID=A0A1A7VCR1_PLAKH|nr:rhoptry-associated protein 1 [Plasmodium knowlesi strain H]OTN67739.1 Rhoptry associated protein I [Plasmodium knowlesi]CAA9990504.1 rhoptry-associated protein 1 [Plasmodium knowlesi strain H]SBO19735.1 rhoptry-associated protein 1, putative [Plasmodium knowlesi strain H]SBO22459.1 rhoptry-associated protein 1, putative [Plasmodium knowlesi strain H]VVS79978.1 rhoptry-associated protein 1 [Plasmodium knowlesi strain H]